MAVRYRTVQEMAMGDYHRQLVHWILASNNMSAAEKLQWVRHICLSNGNR